MTCVYSCGYRCRRWSDVGVAFYSTPRLHICRGAGHALFRHSCLYCVGLVLGSCAGAGQRAALSLPASVFRIFLSSSGLFSCLCVLVGPLFLFFLSRKSSASGNRCASVATGRSAVAAVVILTASGRRICHLHVMKVSMLVPMTGRATRQLGRPNMHWRQPGAVL